MEKHRFHPIAWPLGVHRQPTHGAIEAMRYWFAAVDVPMTNTKILMQKWSQQLEEMASRIGYCRSR